MSTATACRDALAMARLLCPREPSNATLAAVVEALRNTGDASCVAERLQRARAIYVGMPLWQELYG
jgi:hypothetical protein